MKYFLLGLILALAVSCKKDHKDDVYVPLKINCPLSIMNLDTAKKLIQGTWKVMEETRYTWTQPGPIYITPQSLGYQHSVNFKNDTARFFINNTPDSVFTYKVFTLGDITGSNFPEDSLPTVAYYSIATGKRKIGIPFTVCGNYLVLHFEMVTSGGGVTIMQKK